MDDVFFYIGSTYNFSTRKFLGDVPQKDQNKSALARKASEAAAVWELLKQQQASQCCSELAEYIYLERNKSR